MRRPRELSPHHTCTSPRLVTLRLLRDATRATLSIIAGLACSHAAKLHGIVRQRAGPGELNLQRVQRPWCRTCKETPRTLSITTSLHFMLWSRRIAHRRMGPDTSEIDRASDQDHSRHKVMNPCREHQFAECWFGAYLMPLHRCQTCHGISHAFRHSPESLCALQLDFHAKSSRGRRRKVRCTTKVSLGLVCGQCPPFASYQTRQRSAGTWSGPSVQRHYIQEPS